MTVAPSKRTSAEIRRKVNHPVIDSDGHYSELFPVFRDYFLDYVKAVGGSRVTEQLLTATGDLREHLIDASVLREVFPSKRWTQMSWEERRDTWTMMPGWVPPHGNILDNATSCLPGLLHQRMEEFGIDYAVLYPGTGLVFPHLQDADLRRVTCRAFNKFNAELYRAYADRMTPAALIPMFTPQEAIEELDYAIQVLGLKVAMIGHVVRPIPAVHRRHPELLRVANRLDSFGLDSEYDYDPFWARCAELKVPLAAHQVAYGIGFRRSLTNYIYNQTGNFAEAGDLLCRSLFLGGVTRRFPTLKFQFLECGVGWACILFAELVARWQKRNIQAIEGYIQKAQRGRGQLADLLQRYGDERVRAHMPELAVAAVQRPGGSWVNDDWAACRITRLEDVRDLFVQRFYFGCEADDPITAWAFNAKVNPFGVHLRATLGSDLGHWDVPDMREIVTESYELVEKGLITEEDFRDFTFTHPTEFYAGVNPQFFHGTPIEKNVAPLVAKWEHPSP